AKRMPFDVDVLKVEIPRGATPETPWRVTRVSRQRYYQAIPTGRASLPEPRLVDYEIAFDQATLEPDSDIYAVMIDRVVSVSPISLDLTSRVPPGELEPLLH